MRQMRAWFMRFRSLFSRSHHERELADEVASTIELEIDANIRAGMTPAEARRAALVKFGSVDATKEAMRDRRGIPFLETSLQDAGYAIRILLKSPRFTIMALLTIVLTVGGITTIFTLVNSILLKPLPYPESDRLVHITETDGRRPGLNYVAVADFMGIQRDSRSFEAVAAYTNLIYDVESQKGPYTVMQWNATPEVFRLLGVRMILGRGFLPEDFKPEAPPIIVLSYELWQSQMGGREDVLGQRFRLPPRPSNRGITEPTIVGVMAGGFKPPLPGRSAAAHVSYPSIWAPLRAGPDELDRRERGTLTTIARLGFEVSLETARAELDAISKRLAAEYPDTHRERTLSATFVLDDVVGSVKPILRIFFGAVSCVLLIGIANLISLQTVRNSAREREISIRAALGAGRSRLIRQLLVETLLLASAGGAFGLFAAWIGTRAVLATLPIRFPRAEGIGLDFTVFLFAFGVSIAVGALVGLIPAWRACGPKLQAVINEGSWNVTTSVRRGSIQRWLTAFETAIALVLLVGASLLANSFWRLLTTDTAINEARLWSVEVALPLTYRMPQQSRDFWTSALNTVRSIPQVESAAMVHAAAPLSGGDITMSGLFAEGTVQNPRQQGASFSNRAVSPDFFGTLGVPILRGRPILQTDTESGERVVVINEMAAQTLWPGEDALGKRMQFGTRDPLIMTVVGIIPNFKHSRLDQKPFPQMYTSYLQDFVYQNLTVMIRLKPEVRRFPDAILSALANLEAKANIKAASMDDIRWTLVAPERFRTGMLLVFAIGATFLAMVGIFGVVSYSVVQRHREIGLRMALGANPRDVTRLMVRQALLPASLGLAAGLAASVELSYLLSNFLFEIQATDPVTFVFAFLSLLAAALLASLIPARKAIRIDPMIALRYE